MKYEACVLRLILTLRGDKLVIPFLFAVISVFNLISFVSKGYESKDVTDTIAENVKGNCTQEMFPIKSETGKVIDFDKAALLSCQAEYALQRNWYPDPIGGLFSYQTWNGMDGFWQNGLAIEAMTNAMIYGNHTRYLSVVKVNYNYVK